MEFWSHNSATPDIQVLLFICQLVALFCVIELAVSPSPAAALYCIVLQMNALQRLEIENDQAARSLEQIVKTGEDLLEQIQQALSDVALTQLKLQALENEEATEPSA